jgi:hypothetical protein
VLFRPPAGVDVATHPPPPNVAAPIRSAWYPGRRLDGGGGACGVRRGAGRRARVRGGGRARRARMGGARGGWRRRGRAAWEKGGGERRRRRATEARAERRRGGRARGKAARRGRVERGRATRRVSHDSGGVGGESGAVGRRKYRESGMEGCAEGESGAEGGAVSPPASTRPAENLGDGGRKGGTEYRVGWGGWW